jgi:drug/metabolite transporter (DMT)-like permease
LKFKGELLILMSSTGFSLMPIFAKLAYAGGASTSTVLTFRFLFAFIMLWVYIFIRGYNYKVTSKQLKLLAVLGGLLYAGSALTLFSSYKFISAGLSEVLIFTYPAMVLVISIIAYKEKLELNKVFAIILSAIGTALVAYVPGQAFSLKGVGLALIAAFFYALYVAFIGYKEFKSIHPVVMTGYVVLFAAIVFIIYGFINGSVSFNFKASSWIYMLLLSFMSTSMAILTFCQGSKMIGVTKASIISTVEPVEAIIFGAVILGERLTFYMILGAIITIMAVISIHIFKYNDMV